MCSSLVLLVQKEARTIILPPLCLLLHSDPNSLLFPAVTFDLLPEVDMRGSAHFSGRIFSSAVKRGVKGHLIFQLQEVRRSDWS